MSDLEMQQYLFDLQGYLVVEGVLDAGQLAALNQLMDQQDLPAPKKNPRFGAPPAARVSCSGANPFATCSTTPGSCRSSASGWGTASASTDSTACT